MPLDAFMQNTLSAMTVARMPVEGLSAMVAETMPVIQHTLAAPVTYQGIGLHSGQLVTMNLLPAPAESGVRFVRTDVHAAKAAIPARYDTVVDTKLCTVLGNEHGTTIATVEHVLSALCGLGLDNVTIEVNGAELPVADGSAVAFVSAILQVGLVPQKAPRRALQILRAVEVTSGQKKARLLPATASSYNVAIIYDNQVIGAQSYDFTLTPAAYMAEIAAARTFGLLSDVEAMHKAGLGKGGSLDNAVIVDDKRILNQEGLRYADEFARHKVLDAIGDLALAGGVVLGRLEGHMSGHKMNNDLLRAVFADPANYRWVTLTDNESDGADSTLPLYMGHALYTGNPINA